MVLSFGVILHMENKTRSKKIDETWIKKIAWILLCLLAIPIFFHGFQSRFLKIFSWSFIQGEGAYPGIALLIGITWLILKRGEIGAKMKGQKITNKSIAIGISALFISIFLQRSYSHSGIKFEIFFLLLTFLALFVIFFEDATRIPIILAALYGFTVIFPFLALKYLGYKLSIASLYTTMFVLKILGFTTYNNAQVLYFINNIGQSRSILINAQCSGIAGITIFIILFVLMTLDIPLPKQKTTILLAFGIVGTFFQNIIRILSLVATAYFYGMDAMWKTHSFIGYIIFTAWFAIFAFIYLDQARRER